VGWPWANLMRVHCISLKQCERACMILLPATSSRTRTGWWPGTMEGSGSKSSSGSFFCCDLARGNPSAGDRLPTNGGGRKQRGKKVDR
jgi:hypothetical protein